MVAPVLWQAPDRQRLLEGKLDAECDKMTAPVFTNGTGILIEIGQRIGPAAKNSEMPSQKTGCAEIGRDS